MLKLTPSDIQAIILSAQVAGTATIISLPLGFITAFLMTFTKVPVKAAFEGLINLPLVLPPVAVGYLLLLLFGREGPIGGILNTFGIDIIFTWWAAVIASIVVGFPLLVRSIRLGMESIDTKLVLASRTLGANWYDTLFSIILPLSLRSIFAGATLMFARSLGEFGATIIVAGNIPGLTQTIPLAIYNYANIPGGEKMALTLCTVSILLSFSVLIINEILFRQEKQ